MTFKNKSLFNNNVVEEVGGRGGGEEEYYIKYLPLAFLELTSGQRGLLRTLATMSSLPVLNKH